MPAAAFDDARSRPTKHHLRVIEQFPFDDSVTRDTMRHRVIGDASPTIATRHNASERDGEWMP
jgi:hypothetical protein